VNGLRFLTFALLGASSLAAAQLILQPPEPAPAVPEPTPSPPTVTPRPAPSHLPQHTELALELAAAARHYLDHRPPGFREDCSGFVEAILTRVDRPIYGTVAQMYEAAVTLDTVHHRQVPFLGDLVFFHNTYDRNRNGKQDDLYSHIAVVIDLEPDGTIVMAHHGSQRSILRMNLDPERVHLKEDANGKTINDVLKYRYDAPFNWPLRLTSQNWAAFATVREGDDWSGLLKRP
jgi:hypothetical protein